MVRVLVTVEPRMYREAIAFAVQRHRRPEFIPQWNERRVIYIGCADPT
jgi:hypothetical protein